MTLDRVPGHANLYIGGYVCPVLACIRSSKRCITLIHADVRSRLFTLKRREALKTANITHVLSVLTLPLDDALFDGYKHLVIDLDDVEEADILQHFPASNAFINDGLQGGGGVLVHW